MVTGSNQWIARGPRPRGGGSTGETHYLRVFINRLRHKIEDDPSHPRTIIAEPGVGYRLVTPS